MHDYYIGHPQLYSKAQTRDVRHILVKTKPQADSIYAQLKAGNDQTWCTLAKKFSQDPSSKDKCGKLTVSKGQTVPQFDKVAFSEKTKTIHAPVHDATYGWFVIEPLSIVHPRATTPEKEVAATIKQQLLQQKKNQAITTWFADLSKSFCKGNKIKYQVGYTPSPDPCASTTRRTRRPSRTVSLADALVELQELTERLRRECPWDREQTARTIVPHTVEEAYEVADAALAGDEPKLLDEIGDLLFQCVFLALTAPGERCRATSRRLPVASPGS